MPTGIYKRTKKHNKAVSNGLLGQKRKFFTKQHIKNMSKVQMGKKFTRQHRLKISKSLIGNCRAHALKGKSRPKFSKIWRQNMSIERKNRFKNPKNHPNYIGGLSFKSYSEQWTCELRRKIRKLDKNLCVKCGKRKYKHQLNVHHIDYNKLNCNINNLISLCVSCNSIVNFNRDYWFAYFQYIIKGRSYGN